LLTGIDGAKSLRLLGHPSKMPHFSGAFHLMKFAFFAKDGKPQHIMFGKAAYRLTSHISF